MSHLPVVLLVTATDVETDAVLELAPYHETKPFGARTYYELGQQGGQQLYLVQSEMGSATPAGSLTTVCQAIPHLNPAAVIAVGIAFGMDPKNQPIGTILVAQQLVSYNPHKVATKDGKKAILPRGDKVTTSATLIDRLRTTVRTDPKQWAKVTFGLVLSGETLVDNLDYRRELQALYPEAKGGEMEGSGIYSACHDQVEWILVKAVCDWADGAKGQNKGRRQKRAAAMAARFVWDTLQRDLALSPRQRATQVAPLTPRAAAPPPPFRVRLLATERDLGTVREQLARHLVAVEGLVVHASDDLTSPAEVVVLLMGRIWEQGRLATAWQRDPAPRRLLLLSDPESDWPPFRLSEPAAEADQFRAAHPHQTFTHPNQIRQQVAVALANLRRELAPQTCDGGGPSLAERAYLHYWEPIWRTGRAKAKAYETSDFYNQVLYVPLDGQASGFCLDAQGQLVAGRKPGEKSRVSGAGHDLLATHETALRLPLSRWACAAPLRLLVLRGSPGAGKTVFLTRFAAALAARLLGQEADPETALPHASGLARQVPIILEANALARQQLTPRCLAEAILTELQATAADPSLALAEVTARLHGGRYLVLVDALDEVPETSNRQRLLAALISLAQSLPATRFLLTTRPDAYTGALDFGKTFQVVELAPFDPAQVERLCDLFRNCHAGTELQPGALRGAVETLARRARKRGDPAFSENPLMLTCICIIYKCYHQLPEEQAQLLELLIAEACKARSARSEQGELNPDKKRELLERLALLLQEQYLQQLEVSRAESQLAEGLAEVVPRPALADCLRWLLETGLIYEEQGPAGPQVRFSHRLFREYLAASKLQSNTTMTALVARLAEAGRFSDPTWLDVTSLIPGISRHADRAAEYAAALEARISDSDPRLWGVLAAAMAANRSLYGHSAPDFANRLAAHYEAHGAAWPLEARLFVLYQLGRLGDPRLNPHDCSYWAEFAPDCYTLGDDANPCALPVRQVTLSRRFWLARYAVTNGEYARFMAAGGYQNPDYWSPEGWHWLNNFDTWFADLRRADPSIKEELREILWPGLTPRYWQDPLLNSPNQPVGGVSVFEAEAYTAWLGREGARAAWWPKGYHISLPSEAQWEAAARGKAARPFPWGAEPLDLDRADLRSRQPTTPVGAYPRGATPVAEGGVLDLSGNCWEWCLDHWQEKAQLQDTAVVDPLGYGNPSLRAVRGGFYNPTLVLAVSSRNVFYCGSRIRDLGFRCCLAAVPEHA